MKYLAQRLGFYLLAAWFSLTLNFFLPRLMPGDPAAAIFGRFRGQLAPEAIEALRASFGLTDEPIYMQYLRYLGHVMQGEFGTSIAYFPASVSSVVSTGLMWTAFLAGTAVVISFVVGTSLGALAAWNRNGLLDRLFPPTISFVAAFPYFWLAMVLLYVFGFQLGWFPTRHAYSAGLTPEWSLIFISDVIAHAVLPGAAIVLASLAGWVLGMRNTMIAVLNDDYIRMARAKGLSSRNILSRYAARNALLPNVTGFGMSLGFGLSGSLLTEIVFSYPGQGYLLIQAVRMQDYPLMQAIFLVTTFAVLAANWLVDIAYYWLDPRTRR